MDCTGISKDNCVAIENPAEVYSAFLGADWPKTDADGWFIYNPGSGSKITSCGDNKIFGGLGAFGNLASIVKLIALPPHYYVRVKFTFYKIDSWDNESFYLYLDG